MDSDSTGDPRERMRGIQRFHQVTRGWNDIAYNQAFSRRGDILEGRGWNFKSAATGIENSHSKAIVFLGADKIQRDDLTPKGREALSKLIKEAIALRKRAAGPNTSLVVKGHTEARDPAGLTACPGAEILSFIHMKGWIDKKPVVRYPRHFYLFAAWYLGEGPVFKKYGPHNMSVRPKQLPPRNRVLMLPYMVALRHFLAQREE